MKLPTPVTPLLGRDAEVATICAHLRNSTQLLTLTGTGGVGKTRLAIECVQLLSDDFADGIYFVSLTEVRSADEVLPFTARVLELDEQPGISWIDLFVAELQHKQVLLVLDNLEHVIDCAPFLAQILHAVPTLKILATSRTTLHLREETLLVITPLPLPDRQTALTDQQALITTALDSPAVKLFVSQLALLLPNFTVTPSNVQTIIAICQRLDGLPLAIELAAVQGRLFALPTLLRRLEQCLDLTLVSPSSTSQHLTLRGAIDWSYQLLPSDTQYVFLQLAVFNGGGTSIAIEHICQLPHNPPTDPSQPPLASILEHVLKLIDQHLIYQWEGSDGELRFGMLETIREYAQDRLRESGLLATIQRYHSEYYLGFAQSAELESQGNIILLWLKRMDAERDNMRAMLYWNLSPEGDPETALKLIATIWRYWDQRNIITQGRLWIARILAATPPSITAERARALHGMGWLGRFSRDLTQIIPFLEQSLAIYTALGDQQEATSVLNNITSTFIDNGDFVQAARYGVETLARARRGDDPLLTAWALLQMARIELWNRNFADALQYAEESLSQAQVSGHSYGIAWSRFILAETLSQSFMYQQAIVQAEASAMIFRELNYTHGTSIALHLLAEIQLALGNTERALDYCGKSMALRSEQEDPFHIARTRYTKGRIALVNGQLQEARTHYEAAHTYFFQAKQAIEEGKALFGLSQVAFREERFQEAQQFLEQFTTIGRQLNNSFWVGLGTCIADALLANLNREQGVVMMQQNIARLREAGDRSNVSFALQLLSLLQLEQGQELPALRTIAEGLQLAQGQNAQLYVLGYLILLATTAQHNQLTIAAAYLCGSAGILREKLGIGYVELRLHPVIVQMFNQLHERIQTHLSSNSTIAQAWGNGRRQPLSEVLAEAQHYVTIWQHNLYDEEQTSSTFDSASSTGDLETIAYTLSHDLRAPLSTIDSYARILMEEYLVAQNDDAQRVYQLIRGETGRMRELIHHLLAFARSGNTALTITPIDMTALVHTVLEEVTREVPAERLLVEIDPLPAAMGDIVLIRQVWINLLENAIKYASYRARIHIQIRSFPEADMHVYQVQDNGVGFEMTQASKLFTVFHRLHSEQEFPGVGVGLAIVQRIVQRHGGAIWANAEPQQGATFSFSLRRVALPISS